MDNPTFRLSHMDAVAGRLVLVADTLNADNAEQHLQALCQMLDASVKEKQTDADLLSWLIDFEGVALMLRAGHYSASVWLETLGDEGQDELVFLHSWLEKQLAG